MGPPLLALILRKADSQPETKDKPIAAFILTQSVYIYIHNSMGCQSALKGENSMIE